MTEHPSLWGFLAYLWLDTPLPWVLLVVGALVAVVVVFAVALDQSEQRMCMRFEARLMHERHRAAAEVERKQVATAKANDDLRQYL